MSAVIHGTVLNMGKNLVAAALVELFVVALLVSDRVAAQDLPDFSGAWVLDSAAPPSGDISKTLVVRQSLTRTNVRGEPMKPFFKDITVTPALESGTSSQTYQIGVEGGTVAGRANGTADSLRTHHRVQWQEQALVIESGSYTGPTPESGQWAERREVWSLDSGGRLHVAITARSSVAASRTVMLVYRRAVMDCGCGRA